MLDTYFKYIYIVLLVLIVVLLLIFFIKSAKLMKKIALANEKLDNTKEVIKNTEEKKQKAEHTIKIFTTISIVAYILKETIKDYKKQDKKNRKISKSFKNTCIKNTSKIRKIKIK